MVSHVENGLGLPKLQEEIQRFLYDQLYPFADIPGDRVDLCICPDF